MDYVGRRVKKEFKGHGTFFGLVKAYDAATGFFKIVYDDGDSEELELTEVSLLSMSAEPPPPQPSGSSAGRLGRKPKKRRRIGVTGKDDDNSTDGAISYSLVDRDGDSGAFDLNLTERLDLNDDAVNCLRDDGDGGNVHGDGTKLHGLDLNEGVNLELDEGLHLNKESIKDDSLERNKMIDLNLDVNEGFEKLSDEREGRCFDLNLQLMEDEVRILEGCDARLGVGENGCSRENMQMKEELVEDDAVGVLENADGDKVDPVVHIDKKEDSQLKNCADVVDNGVVNIENVAPLAAQVKRRGRKKKNASDNSIEVATQLDIETGNMNLELERRDETPSKNVSDLVDCDNGVSETVLRGRRGRKKRELPNNEVTLTTPETGLRRSSRRAKRAALSDVDQVFNETELVGINQQFSSPAISNVSQERVTVTARASFSDHVALPPKVKLPPPSCDMDLIGVSLFHLVSVYTFLRSFSTLLFLSPFKLDDFVASVKSSDSSLLFDFIHVSLLKTLRKHLETLAAEGVVSASDCLRSLNWDFLDLITWPMYVVEYLLLHSPGCIPGLDLCQLKFFQNDYYKMPISAKVEILQHLCDDVIETEAFKLELNRRILATDRQTDLDRNMKLESSRKRKSIVDVASTSCITGDDAEEPADWNSDECCLCKMDGNLICCDGCPAAFHSRCVGVVSSMLPEGDWYCPECVIERDKPWMKVSKSTRGAELLGIDPYGRLYYSSCGYLLVLESCNDEYMFGAYDRNDLTALIEALESSPFIYDKLINAICKNWNVSRGSCGTKNDLDTRSCSIQSAFPENGQIPDMLLVPSEAIIRKDTCSKKRSDEKSMVTIYSSNEELLNAERVTALLETGNNGSKMENHLASSEGSAEVSQTSMKTDNPKESVLECTKRCFDTSDCCDIPEKLEKEKNIRSKSSSHKPYSINSKVEVHYGTNYMNCYEFARTASAFYEEYSRKSSDKTSGDAPRSIEEVLAGQLKIVSNRSVEFSWSNIQNSNMTSRKERCGWCLYCRVTEEERECLFSMNDSIPAVEKFSSEALGIQSQKNVKNHLIDVMCHIICMEDHLQGLLLGPWLNPDYSMLWHASVCGATDIALLKKLLLKLESNLHHLALSADWRKHVDSVATVGSATHIISSSARASSKHGISRKRAKSSDVSGPSSNAATGLSLFWWRGGRGSRTLFNWKVLPHSLASKAARQGGRRKIPGILYPDSGEYAKRTKYDSWRAAVETSRSVEQLALQVRELDANIRWDDIGNNKLLLKIEMDSKKPVRSFKKVIVRRKCSEGAAVRYLLDFGKRRFIPDVVVKHGSKPEDSSNEKKRYWLEESHVPLHLVKAFEEKRIARKSNTMKSGKFSESSGVMKKPLKEKGFSYLFSRAERLDYYQCVHCKKDVLIREAVSCQHCKGFFHKRHVRKSAGYITTQCKYTCHKCQDLKFVKTDARKGKSESTKLKNASKSVKLIRSGRGRKKGKAKLLVNSKSKKGVPFVVPLRRSARNAERIAKLPVQNSKVKKRKRGRKPKSDKYKSKKPKNNSCKKQRTPVTSSYWLNGLRLSRKPGDERHLRNRKLLVLSGEVDCILNKTKCSLCREVEHNSKLNYVGCEICGDWFHGDALDLGADKIENVIGFRCHMCLNKTPPVCPRHSPAESSKTELFSENNAKTECTGEGPYCLANPEDGLDYQKSHLDDKSIDTLSTVNMEKQLQGSVPESHLKDLEMAEKIFLGNDPIELGGAKKNVLNTLETVSIFPNSDMVKEAERQTTTRDLVENGMTNNDHSDICSR
ncbi:DDT domain-containing protein PTM-like isoform X2 [Salvia miltiorrhiza]|uniref:DDT domain-containing protein PTM-like isoform X2 n=1 Tax=Salvia miltiorrhiza TaxID=226208 RepID=UPI0025ABF36F|nr:DDT domain-containing protein PTM-like isoform X2 [Salvia miltiorrhiza]XP_057790214.1 DDT domain-containing protein PTM-like isoform X2 [Salvia miltiorrhiza]XP_057790215.1 DDT domain-containing protein PTM-like isoform X2 [Salvia miltiorrhiza]XP_057790216.1 DDT domain-containing protein PTM-like isoform X2 [Salvia miltiorrhiza]XP_057790217.1 DDT domain-containing protein PTM-like isoform X2 [Salvia miltiorrhiza]XP_057790218.1 DDT domain-containing protein PTM-like isoform X2 [Salvia miltior